MKPAETHDSMHAVEIVGEKERHLLINISPSSLPLLLLEQAPIPHKGIKYYDLVQIKF